MDGQRTAIRAYRHEDYKAAKRNGKEYASKKGALTGFTTFNKYLDIDANQQIEKLNIQHKF